MILIQKISEIIGKLISPLIIKRLSKMSLNVDLPNQLTNNKSTNTCLLYTSPSPRDRG